MSGKRRLGQVIPGRELLDMPGEMIKRSIYMSAFKGGCDPREDNYASKKYPFYSIVY
jgi:hypothetical protein